MAVRVRLDIGYDGTGFSGWARQPGQRTVQGTLEDALTRVLSLAEPAALTVASTARTRASTRAARSRTPTSRQTAGRTADTPPRAGWPGCCRPTCGCTGSHLPRPASTPGSPRSGAATPTVLRRPEPGRPVGPPCHPLVPQHARRRGQNQAAQHCLGEHDFAAFCRRRDGASTVRTLLRLDWARPEQYRGRGDGGGGRVLPQHGPRAGRCAAQGRDGSSTPGWPAEVLAAGYGTRPRR